VIYDFAGQVDQLSGTPGFPARVEDAVTGTFSIDPQVQDVNPNPQQGVYPQTAPAGVEIHFARTVFRADPAGFPPYQIVVLNNVAVASPSVQDTLQWSAGDPPLASSLGIDNVQANLVLQDETATVVTNDGLPSRLDLHDFSNAWISVCAINFGVNEANILWTIHVRIDSIVQR
jgi:hypothetical protein